MSRVAVLGLGRMGASMAAQLVRAGHDVTVWNRGDAAYLRLAEELGDVDPPARAATPAAEVADVDVVITMLADGPALESVLFGPDGVAGAVRAGTVVCDMGTMVGGPADDARVVEPVLRAFAGSVLRVGDTGSGQAMKLAVNSVVHSLNASLSEAIVLAERGGVPNSAVAAPFLLYKRAAFEDPAGQPVAFTVDLMRKDLSLIEEFAASRDSPVPVAEMVRSVSDAASVSGFGAHDMSAIAEHHRMLRK
jgi:3-hydroxyisobutyrate dehydrogenase-like beta-hydroxyacid dehydrogenase